MKNLEIITNKITKVTFILPDEDREIEIKIDKNSMAGTSTNSVWIPFDDLFQWLENVKKESEI
jgi:hypothetical protein